VREPHKAEVSRRRSRLEAVAAFVQARQVRPELHDLRAQASPVFHVCRHVHHVFGSELIVLALELTRLSYEAFVLLFQVLSHR
jgi:hypothetical protein